MEAWDYIKKGKACIWKEKFSIFKSKKICPEAFANIKDKNEITVIINQSKIEDNKAIMGIEKDWKIITFDMKLPFGLVGFFFFKFVKEHTREEFVNKLRNLSGP